MPSLCPETICESAEICLEKFVKFFHMNIFLASFSRLKPLCDGATATKTARRVVAAVAAVAAVTAPWHYHPDRIATYVCYLMLANYWLLFC